MASQYIKKFCLLLPRKMSYSYCFRKKNYTARAYLHIARNRPIFQRSLPQFFEGFLLFPYQQCCTCWGDRGGLVTMQEHKTKAFLLPRRIQWPPILMKKKCIKHINTRTKVLLVLLLQTRLQKKGFSARAGLAAGRCSPGWRRAPTLPPSASTARGEGWELPWNLPWQRGILSEPSSIASPLGTQRLIRALPSGLNQPRTFLKTAPWATGRILSKVENPHVLPWECCPEKHPNKDMQIRIQPSHILK